MNELTSRKVEIVQLIGVTKATREYVQMHNTEVIMAIYLRKLYGWNVMNATSGHLRRIQPYYRMLTLIRKQIKG